MSVKVEQISRFYGTQKALDNVSFEVTSGQVVGFLGPNGAGKSTMMKIITCFIPQSSGKVSVEGFDVSEQSLEVRKIVGYLPENNPLYPDMYIKEYLSFIGGIHMPSSDIDKRVKEMIDITGLGPEQNKKIGMLSKGYRQRVGLAQAMIHHPKVLILDEPTSGLDPNQLRDIRELIKNIGKEKTVILSTHIMQEVEAICSRVIIINKGKIVADDKTHILQQRAATTGRIIVEFDKQINIQLLSKIPGVGKAEHTEGNFYHLTANSSQDIRPLVFRFAVENEVAVVMMQQEGSSIEAVFQQLTGNV
jgi:ABC-2 type transport system ATP-binding protein